MKKAFYIETIVIFIVVAALTVLIFLKLNSSKSEAEISKAIRNLATLISDIDSYYSEHKEFTSIELMSRVGVNKDSWFLVKSDKCLHFSTFKDYIMIKKTDRPEELCKIFLSYDSVKSLLIGKEMANDSAKNTNINESQIIYIKVGNKFNSSIL